MKSIEFYIFKEIDDDLARSFLEWVHSFDNLSPMILKVYINSYGGSLTAAVAIINAMHSTQHTVVTIATGAIMSAAVLIFVSGRQRAIYDDCEIMSHQFSTSTGYSKYHELESSAKQFKLIAKLMQNIYIKASDGKLTRDIVSKKLLSETDIYLTPKQLKKFGLVDAILEVS